MQGATSPQSCGDGSGVVTPTKVVRIEYGSDTLTMRWDPAQASAPIVLDGDATPYSTADARHRISHAVRLVLGYAYRAPIYETEEEARADERDPDGDNVVVWDDVAYEVLEDGDDEIVATSRRPAP